MANIEVTKILKKEMDRKDFLKYTSGVVLAVIGVTGFVNTLTKLNDNSPASQKQPADGYGASTYGR